MLTLQSPVISRFKNGRNSTFGGGKKFFTFYYFFHFAQMLHLSHELGCVSHLSLDRSIESCLHEESFHLSYTQNHYYYYTYYGA